MSPEIIAEHKTNLAKLIPLVKKLDGGYCWLYGVLGGDIESLAECVAHLMVDYCCPGQELKDSWHAKCNGLAYANPIDGKLLEGYLGPIFGPKGKSSNETHLQGAVAEFLWYLLFEKGDDVPFERIRLEGPDFQPTSPGGDGLSIYKDGDAAYFFKLWEIKKHTSAKSPKTKVALAASQLDTRATAYLAKYSQVLARTESDNDLATFYTNLPRYWIEQSAKAGVGLSVSSNSDFPEDSFEVLLTQFGYMNSKHRLSGVSIYIEKFPELVRAIQQKIWEGME